MAVPFFAAVFGCAVLSAAAAEPWVDALERSAVVFDRPNGGPCRKEMKEGARTFMRQFTTGRPEYIMPVGAGNLSAMVSFGEDALELHLSQADYYAATNGVCAPEAWKLPKEVRNTVALRSPGHVRIRFAGLRLPDISSFEQRMDLLRGRVTLSVTTARGRIAGEVFGDRATGALVVLIEDGRRGAASPAVEQEMKPLRPPALVRADGGRLKAVIGVTDEAAAAAFAADDAEQKAACERWWRDYWSRGWVALEGDRRAALLTRLWYVNVYVYGSVGCSRLPPKFNGGPGIVFGDERSWGDNFWWQNTREMIWPLAGANRAGFAKAYLEFFSGFAANSAGGWNFKRPPKHGACVLPETAALSRHPLVGAPQCPERPFDAPYEEPSAAQLAEFLRERRARRGNLKSHIYSSGAEYLQQLVEYMRFTGDRSVLPHVAKWLRSQTELYLRLCTREADGRWHVRCTNVNESWVKVDDSIVDLAAARFCFAQAAAHGVELGLPTNLVAAAAARLDRLAEFPHGAPYVDYHSKNGLRLVAGPDVYHPCVLAGGMHKSNFENNELYVIHPFAMAGADVEGPQRRRAVDTYLNGPNRDGGAGWTLVAVAAARLRLTNAVDLVYGHARRSCCWPYGGANSPGSYLYRGSHMNASVYLDSSGVMQTGVQELLLQSHAEEPDPSWFTGGPVRFLPCAPACWSGAFKLRARGGFVIEAYFSNGRPERALVLSDCGRDFIWIDPSTGERRARKTAAGERFMIQFKDGSKRREV